MATGRVKLTAGANSVTLSLQRWTSSPDAVLAFSEAEELWLRLGEALGKDKKAAPVEPTNTA